MIGEVKDGKFVPNGSLDKMEGKKVELRIVRDKRSNKQNRYMHGVMFPELAKAISKSMGKEITVEFAKEVVKYKFLRIATDAGIVVMPTAKLNTAQCTEFIESCLKYAADTLGVEIPVPEP